MMMITKWRYDEIFIDKRFHPQMFWARVCAIAILNTSLSNIRIVNKSQNKIIISMEKCHHQ